MVGIISSYVQSTLVCMGVLNAFLRISLAAVEYTKSSDRERRVASARAAIFGSCLDYGVQQE